MLLILVTNKRFSAGEYVTDRKFCVLKSVGNVLCVHVIPFGDVISKPESPTATNRLRPSAQQTA